MGMSHIYQPMRLNTLSERRGRASVRDIAAAFLAHDESQLEIRRANHEAMAGSVMQKRGLVESSASTSANGHFSEPGRTSQDRLLPPLLAPSLASSSSVTVE